MPSAGDGSHDNGYDDDGSNDDRFIGLRKGGQQPAPAIRAGPFGLCRPRQGTCALPCANYGHLCGADCPATKSRSDAESSLTILPPPGGSAFWGGINGGSGLLTPLPAGGYTPPNGAALGLIALKVNGVTSYLSYSLTSLVRINTPAVPEASSTTLLIAGLGVAGLQLRRRASARND